MTNCDICRENYPEDYEWSPLKYVIRSTNQRQTYNEVFNYSNVCTSCASRISIKFLVEGIA